MNPMLSELSWRTCPSRHCHSRGLRRWRKHLPTWELREPNLLLASALLVSSHDLAKPQPHCSFQISSSTFKFFEGRSGRNAKTSKLLPDKTFKFTGIDIVLCDVRFHYTSACATSRHLMRWQLISASSHLLPQLFYHAVLWQQEESPALQWWAALQGMRSECLQKESQS